MNKIEQELEKVNYFIDHAPKYIEGACKVFLEDKTIDVNCRKNNSFDINCGELIFKNLNKEQAKDTCKKIAYGEQEDLSIIKLLRVKSEYEYTNKFGSMFFSLHLDDTNDYQSSWRYYLLLNGYILCEGDYCIFDELQFQNKIDEYIKLFNDNKLVLADGGIVIVNRDGNGIITDIVKCIGEDRWCI